MNFVIKLVLVCGLPLWAGCSNEEAPATPIQHVNVQEIQAHDIEYIFDYPGVVQGVIDYPVIPRISGAIF
jgi:hypothetical protein